MAPPDQHPAAAKEVDFEQVIDAIANAIREGDIVNFRFLFSPFSPARESSTESFDMPKYAYLLPGTVCRGLTNCEETESERRFAEARTLVKRPQTIAEIKRELEANRPPQLPWELVLELGDNAVRLRKYSSAAQAYELLRVRARMQREFLDQADAALDAGDVPKGVRGYIIGTGLAYDYAAFPEPLPMTPDFQTRAFVLHAEYPARREDCVGLREPGALVQTALSYLLLDPEAAARLDSRPMEMKLAFLKELVHQRDPEWEDFLTRLREADVAARELAQRLEQMHAASALAEEINAEMASTDGANDPGRIPALLLGHGLEDGEWWQYLKELVHKHPAAALLVARQAVGDFEILVPGYAAESPVARALGL